MAIQQKLQTKLAQKLILTPSLQQAIKLLPMSTLELADLLNQEVVENPLLEEVPTEELAAVEQTPAEKEGAEDRRFACPGVPGGSVGRLGRIPGTKRPGREHREGRA